MRGGYISGLVAGFAAVIAACGALSAEPADEPRVNMFSVTPKAMVAGITAKELLFRWDVSAGAAGVPVKRSTITKLSGPGPALNLTTQDLSGQYHLSIPRTAEAGNAVYSLTVFDQKGRSSSAEIEFPLFTKTRAAEDLSVSFAQMPAVVTGQKFAFGFSLSNSGDVNFSPLSAKVFARAFLDGAAGESFENEISLRNPTFIVGPRGAAAPSLQCEFPKDAVWTELILVIYYGEQELKRETFPLDYRTGRVFYLKK